jgi:anti-anti-sigma factor
MRDFPPTPGSTRLGDGPNAHDHAAALTCEIAHGNGSATVVVAGEMDLATGGRFEREVAGLLTLPLDCIDIDASRLSFVDSSGLHALDNVREAAEERGIRFALTSVPQQLSRLLDITGMRAVFSPDDAGPTG